MSLRGRIVLLFVGLAILPLLGVAAFGARQAEGLVARVMTGVLDGASSRLSGDLDRTFSSVESRLDRAALTLREDSLAVPRDLAGWATALGVSEHALAYMEMVDPAGQVVRSWGGKPTEPTHCWSDRFGSLTELSQQIYAGGATLRTGIWPDQLDLPAMDDRTRTFTVVDRPAGHVVLASPCRSSIHEAVARAVAGASTVGASKPSTGRFSSFQPLNGRPWTAAASVSKASVVGPLREIQRSYWFFVLLLTLSTALAFSVLLREVVGSLEKLTRAAERIGEGDLDPWLPPPGKDEVGRLSMAFAQMLQRLRQMIQRVDQEGRLAVVGRLTSYLAHEIRNPLSSIRMNLQVLDRDLRHGRIPDDSRELMEVSLREVDRLATSVNQVLRLGAASGGQRVEVSLKDTVEEAVGLLAEQCRHAEVDVRLELDPTADRVRAVPGHLKGVLMNLLVNAVEAQPDGGSVTVSSGLAVSSEGGPTVAVRVRDQGHGISPKLRDRVFQPFFTTKSQGSGIGLAAAQQTMRDGGGDLYLAELPETAQGAEFVVELPLAAVASEVTEPRAQLPQWMKSGRRAIAARAFASRRPRTGMS